MVLLAGIDDAMVQLAVEAADTAALDSLRRALHTLKGSVGLAAFDSVSAVALERQRCFEDLAEQGTGLHRHAIRHHRSSGHAAPPDSRGRRRCAGEQRPRRSRCRTRRRVPRRSGQRLAQLEQAIPLLESAGAREHVTMAVRALHTIEGSAGLVGLTVTSTLAKTATDALERPASRSRSRRSC